MGDMSDMPEPCQRLAAVRYGEVLLDCEADYEPDRVDDVCKRLCLVERGRRVDNLGRVVLDLRTEAPWLDAATSTVSDRPPPEIACAWLQFYGTGTVAVRSRLRPTVLRRDKTYGWRLLLAPWANVPMDVTVACWRFHFEPDQYDASQDGVDESRGMAVYPHVAVRYSGRMALNRHVFEAVALSHRSVDDVIGLAYAIGGKPEPPYAHVAVYVPDGSDGRHAHRAEALDALAATALLGATSTVAPCAEPVLVGDRHGLLYVFRCPSDDHRAVVAIREALGATLNFNLTW